LGTLKAGVMVEISEEAKLCSPLLYTLGSECLPAGQRVLHCRNPKQTKTLAGIMKPQAIFTPATLLKAMAHEYIFIFLRI
jgi:hypothetical protein